MVSGADATLGGAPPPRESYCRSTSDLGDPVTLYHLSIAAAASGLGFVHCTFGCVAPDAAPPVVEVRDAVSDEGVATVAFVIARQGAVVDTLRPVAGAPGRFQGRAGFPEGFTLTVSGPSYSDFEDGYDLDETGGCGMGATTIYVRLTPAP